MKAEDIKVLEFRSELIELLQKYNYQISSGGDLDFITIDTPIGNTYDLNGSELTVCSYDGHSIMKSYIEKFFEYNKLQQSWATYTTGIITMNEWKARVLFNKLHTESLEVPHEYIQSRTFLELRYSDGALTKWIKPDYSSRGYRFNRVYVDEDVTLTEFQRFVIPLCTYCNKEDIIVF